MVVHGDGLFYAQLVDALTGPASMQLLAPRWVSVLPKGWEIITRTTTPAPSHFAFYLLPTSLFK